MDQLLQLFQNKVNKSTDLFRQRQKHYGNANSDKILYYIEEDNKDVGFFAMYRYWLEYLYFADVCGYAPVIYAGDHFSYKENKPVNNIQNPFEYYFLQPVQLNLDEVKSSKNVIISDIMHRTMVELIFTGKVSHYKYNRRYLYFMSRIVKKYMHFNKYMEEYLNKSLEALNFGNEKILGVHIRGTDFRAKYNNHPVYVTENECFLEIDRILARGSYNRIFLATDDKRILANFIRKYGTELCFFEDVERSNGNRSIAFSYRARDNHKYLLGKEVIRDMYALSMCDGLVAGVSQVAICAQINKLARNEKYDDIKIIDKGVYKNNHSFVRYT